jgi:hypothetical protein
MKLKIKFKQNWIQHSNKIEKEIQMKLKTKFIKQNWKQNWTQNSNEIENKIQMKLNTKFKQNWKQNSNERKKIQTAHVCELRMRKQAVY